MTYRILNTREKKRLAEGLNREYGLDEKIFKDLVLFESGDEVWAVTRECAEFDASLLRLDSLGIQIMRAGKPTIAGVQLFFKGAKLTDLTEAEAKDFLDGKTICKKGGIAAYNGHPIDLAAELPAGGIRRR